MGIQVTEWKPIPGFDPYEVSNNGRVRRGFNELKPQIDARGRRRYTLSIKGKVSRHFASRLVLESFIGPCPKGMECCHNNGDATDNRPENLRWDTHSSNIMDRYLHGTATCGELVNTAKLNRGAVETIRTRRANGEKLRPLALEFGVTETMISYICNRKSWKHVAQQPESEACHFETADAASEVALNGGKHYLAPKIAALMPPALHYVEPFFGGGSVLLARDPEGTSELVNDINGRLMNFWRVLQHPLLFDRFRQRLSVTPLSRDEWERAHEQLAGRDAFHDAVAFFIDCRQSRAGGMKTWTSITRNRTRRGMNGNVSEWLGAVDGLPEVAQRMRRVVVENKPALEVIEREDTPNTLFFLDPPYLHETRVSKDAYAHEMSEADHCELLNLIRACKGKVMISGYPSKLYDSTLNDWSRHTFTLPNNAAGGKKKRRMTEVIWCNF